MASEEKRSTGDWRDRLFAERDGIQVRLDKLIVFMHDDGYTALPDEERGLLMEQAQVMRKYVDVLDRRLALTEKRQRDIAAIVANEPVIGLGLKSPAA